MTVLVSFLLLLLNSVVLYVVPEGRIAYWSDWHFLGLSKTEWGEQHITVGVLFVLAGIVHIFYNWGRLVFYLRNAAKEVSIINPALAVAMAITLLVAAGTYFQLAPMRTIVDFGKKIKERAAEQYGEPPYGHAEFSSLNLLCKKEGLDPGRSLELLQAAGLKVAGGRDTLLAIATNNNMTPQQVYVIIAAAKAKTSAAAVPGHADGAGSFPDSPRPGFGRLTLMEVCSQYRLDPQTVAAGLAGKGISADPAQTIREIGEKSGRAPMEIFEAIRELAIAK